MAIEGEIIAEFDATALRLDGSNAPRIALSVISAERDVLAIQSAWEQDGRAPVTFHWPAVFNRNPDATTLVVHDGREPGNAQALVQCMFEVRVPCDMSKRGLLAYVSFVEIAPWNKVESSLLHGLGTFLIVAVSTLAVSQGHSGVLGLHSLESASGFYDNLGFRRLDCMNEYKELYFELGLEGARSLRSSRGVPT